MLKLKAIENILLKLQQGKTDHPSEEAKHVMALLEDVKGMGTT